MKLLTLLSILVSLNSFGQDWIQLDVKLDSITGKYGYVDSSNNFKIEPKFDEARDFISDYASVKVDTLWGIIDASGNFQSKPKYEKISFIYRNHFIESGTNMKFRSINGELLYDYLYIPGPFSQMKDYIEDEEVKQLPDYGLMVSVIDLSLGRRPCRYYQQFRPYNWIAIDTKRYGKMMIDYVLDNPEKIKDWIAKDIEFEAAFERGEIDCCGSGPYCWEE
jgi:hypothetical protein